MKFKIGDKVRVKDDLLVGAEYYNENSTVSDIFSNRMRINLGKEATIIAIHEYKYLLDISQIHTYTDGMLESIDDYYNRDNELDKHEYFFNIEVENIVNHMLKLAPEQLINGALDKGDKKLFDELTKKYYEDKCKN